MVTSCLKWDWQPAKYTIPFVQDWRGFPMHDAVSSDYLSPIDLTDALMPKTNAQHGDPRPKMTNKIVADPSLIRCSRSRRNADFLGAQLLNLIDGCPVIPPHHQFRAEFAKILNQVVGERVVVIQYQDHIFAPLALSREKWPWLC